MKCIWFKVVFENLTLAIVPYVMFFMNKWFKITPECTEIQLCVQWMDYKILEKETTFRIKQDKDKQINLYV